MSVVRISGVRPEEYTPDELMDGGQPGVADPGGEQRGVEVPCAP